MAIYRKGEDQFPLSMKAFAQSVMLNPDYPKLDVTLRNLKQPASSLENFPVSGGQIALLKSLGKIAQDKPLPENVTSLGDYKIRKGN